MNKYLLHGILQTVNSKPRYPHKKYFMIIDISEIFRIAT